MASSVKIKEGAHLELKKEPFLIEMKFYRPTKTDARNLFKRSNSLDLKVKTNLELKSESMRSQGGVKEEQMRSQSPK